MKKICAMLLAVLLAASPVLTAPAFAEETTVPDKQWAEMVYHTFESALEALESGDYDTALRSFMGDGLLLHHEAAPKQIKVNITNDNVFDYFSINDEAMPEFDENGELARIELLKTCVLNCPGYEINMQESSLVCNVAGDYNFYTADRDEEHRIDVSGVSFGGLILDPSNEFESKAYPTEIYTQTEGIDTISFSGYSFFDAYPYFERVPVIQPRTVLLEIFMNQSSYISDPLVFEFTEIEYGFRGTLVLDRIG